MFGMLINVRWVHTNKKDLGIFFFFYRVVGQQMETLKVILGAAAWYFILMTSIYVHNTSVVSGEKTWVHYRVLALPLAMLHLSDEDWLNAIITVRIYCIPTAGDDNSLQLSSPCQSSRYVPVPPLNHHRHSPQLSWARRRPEPML
jgi:hypothetical protein